MNGPASSSNPANPANLADPGENSLADAPVQVATPQKERPPQITGGFLNVNKPAGMTSMDVIRVIRRLTGQRKVGHGGTLDPDATGVLPICIGRATRFIDRFVQGRKVYQATARFGTATDTYDASGRVTAEFDASAITRVAIEAVLPRFTGPISQVPPMYSAVKIDGVRLYKLARAGKEVERKAREVMVYSLEITSWGVTTGEIASGEPPSLELTIECGSGFYARSVVHEIGLALDNAAHLAGLVRSQVGPFILEDAVTLDEIEQAANNGDWERLLYPIDAAFLDLPAVVMDPVQEEAVGHGQSVQIGVPGIQGDAGKGLPAGGTEVRAYNRDGELIALMIYDAVLGQLTPIRVLMAN